MKNISEESNTEFSANTDGKNKIKEIMNPTETSHYPPATTPTRVYGPNESRRMLKNVFLISFSFAFLFTAFQSMANLQSSLNSVSNAY